LSPPALRARFFAVCPSRALRTRCTPVFALPLPFLPAKGPLEGYSGHCKVLSSTYALMRQRAYDDTRMRFFAGWRVPHLFYFTIVLLSDYLRCLFYISAPLPSSACGCGGRFATAGVVLPSSPCRLLYFITGGSVYRYALYVSARGLHCIPYIPSLPTWFPLLFFSYLYHSMPSITRHYCSAS
jgi:hypothetical protein